MTACLIIDGRQIAETIKQHVQKAVQLLQTHYKITPGLRVIWIGDNQASAIYVRNKQKVAQKLGIQAEIVHQPANFAGQELLDLIHCYNHDVSVHGILVQLPLPQSIDSLTVMQTLDPDKDVDGFHPFNAGLLWSYPDHLKLVPCTPAGCLTLIKQHRQNLKGLKAVVIGRSLIVGKPMAGLLLKENCTVTIAHSHTQNLKEIVQEADIVVAAIGQPNFIQGDWVKPGATVIDVGINRLPTGNLVGDICFEEAAKKAGAITPVPGGVGPMTIAQLMVNTVLACCYQHGLNPKEIINIG